jgi:hypothetical protein
LDTWERRIVGDRGDRKRAPSFYEYGGMVYRVPRDDAPIECLIGTEWRPAHITFEALRDAGARLLVEEETIRVIPDGDDTTVPAS